MLSLNQTKRPTLVHVNELFWLIGCSSWHVAYIPCQPSLTHKWNQIFFFWHYYGQLVLFTSSTDYLFFSAAWQMFQLQMTSNIAPTPNYQRHYGPTWSYQRIISWNIYYPSAPTHKYLHYWCHNHGPTTEMSFMHWTQMLENDQTTYLKPLSDTTIHMNHRQWTFQGYDYKCWNSHCLHTAHHPSMYSTSF